MTKYILHGGNTIKINPDNNSFFREMTVGTKGRTLVLLNYFSREESEIQQCFGQDKQRFLENSKNKNLTFEIAELSTLEEQIKRAQIMYMRGGETSKLVKVMSRLSNIPNLFKGKVIAGSSAGVYVLTKYHWKNDIGEIGEGLGVLNFKALCHYEPKKTDVINKLLVYKENIPILTLPNYKWIILYQ